MPASDFPHCSLRSVCAFIWARSARRNLILTRAVALGDPRGRKQDVSALSVFLIVFSVWSGLGALSAPKLDSDESGVVWVGADGWEQIVSARFRFSPLFVEVCVCYYLGALSAPKSNTDTGDGLRVVTWTETGRECPLLFPPLCFGRAQRAET